MGLFGNNQSSSTNPSASSTQKKKILIVEDEKLLVDALELKFTNEGYEVLSAENGKVGLEVMASSKPDLILLDLMMPVMSGQQMLAEIRGMPEFRKIPVIVLTNAGDADNMRQTQLYYNASGFLIKSNVTIDDIVARVKGLLHVSSF